MNSGDHPSQAPRTIFRRAFHSLAVTALVAVVVVLVGLSLDRQNTTAYRHELRLRTENEASLIRARIAAEIGINVTIARDLANLISLGPSPDSQETQRQVNWVLIQNPQIASIALAPDYVVSTVFPPDRARLGHDVREPMKARQRSANEPQNYAARFYGPLPEPDGGSSFAIVFPVFTHEGSGSRHLWGAIEVRMSTNRFYAATGLDGQRATQSDESHPHLDHLSIAVRDVRLDGKGPPQPFIGPAAAFRQNPVLDTIDFPGGEWELAAIPRDGWEVMPPNQVNLRLIIIVAGCVIVIPVLLTGLLLVERNRNIEDGESRERELEDLSRKLDLALDSYKCGIWEATLGQSGARWDERMHQLHGLDYVDGFVSEEQWLGVMHPDDRALALGETMHFQKPGDATNIVARVLLPDGGVRYVRSVGKVHEPTHGAARIVGIAFDVTDDSLLTAQLQHAKDEAIAKNRELEVAKSRIEHNALHDPLTALANRRKLDVALEGLTEESRLSRQKFALLHIDLDRFKEINDTLGHAAGDAMLVHASKVLARNVRSTDLVARIGGDEFVIVAMGAAEPAPLAALAARIIEEMRQPIDFQGFSCRCGVSIGIAQANGMNLDARKVLINADLALYRAKSTGRNRYEFFNQNLQAEIVNSKRTADAILAGLENGEFSAWYQPQFSARTMELTGVEALVRWNHPTRGVLTPDHFLRIADDLNVTHVLDRIVLETVLKDKMRWAAKGLHIPKVSVNVSSRRLHDDNLIATLKDLPITPGELSFELVESIFLDESEDVVSHNLDRIKDLGIDIEIDDFGTGHTSIVSLLKLKPKRLKIDRQLVRPLLTSPHELALVRSIVDIARSLGVETVAEGVETFEHAAMLRDLGCDLLQGYAFARPLSFDDFVGTAAGAGWRLAS